MSESLPADTSAKSAGAKSFLRNFLTAIQPGFETRRSFTDSGDPSRQHKGSIGDTASGLNAMAKFIKDCTGDAMLSLEGRGFVLTFDAPKDDAPVALPPLKASLVLEHEDGRKALVYLATGDAAAVAALRADLEPLDGDSYTIATDMPLPFGDWGLDEAGESIVAEKGSFKVYDFGDLETGFFPIEGDELESSEEGDAPESSAVGEIESDESLRARIIDMLQNGNPNPAQDLALRYAGRGFYPIPVNGIVPVKKSKGMKVTEVRESGEDPKSKKLECLCQEGKRRYAEKTRKPVVECGSNAGKHPMVDDWQGHNASRDPDVLMHLFAAKFTKYRSTTEDGLNIGFVTGEHTGTVILDIDGDEGYANLAKLIVEHGDLPESVTVITGSGGTHVYFRVPVGLAIKNSTSKIAPKIDFRGERGFGVAPPSKHKSGGYYRFKEGHSPDDIALAEMPDWLIKLAIEGGEKEAAEKGGKGSSKKSNAPGRGKARSASTNDQGWQGYLDEMGDQPGGRGFNGPIFEAMCSFFRKNAHDADATEFLEAYAPAFEKADKSKGGREKYHPDHSYIAEQLENARKAIRDTPQNDYAISVDDDGWITIGGDNTRFCIAQHEGRDWIHTVEWEKDDKGNMVRGVGDPCFPQFKLVAHADDKAGVSATVTIEFESRHNGWKTITFQKDAPYDRNAFLGMLARVSFPVENEAGTIAFFKLLDFPQDTWIVDRTGWHDGAMLHPSGVVLPAYDKADADAPQKLRLRGDPPAGDWRKGTLEDWKAAFAPAFDNEARGREQFALGGMSGCAGIVAGFVGMSGFPILNLHGNTSRGKSTSLMLAASACGAPNQRGAYQSLRKTDNGMESILSARSGITVAFDEGKTTNADTLDNIIWMMAHGVGKTRATVTGDSRVEKEFCGFAMTANEVPLAQMMAAAKKSEPGGFHARVCDVDVSGVPELTGKDKDSFFASLDGIKQNYGHAWEPVAKHLQSVGVEHVASALDRFAKELAGDDADAFTTRSAKALALVWFSGTVMQELGLIPACDLARVVRWAWGTRAVESTVDPFTRAMETLSSNVALRRGIDIYEWDEALITTLTTHDDGSKETVVKKPQRYREAAAFIYMSGLDELLLVPLGKLADLCGGHMSGGMIRDQMKARGMLVLSGKKDPKPRWSNLPDGQTLSHYRIKISELSKREAE